MAARWWTARRTCCITWARLRWRTSTARVRRARCRA
jgi:hypothetical protein